MNYNQNNFNFYKIFKINYLCENRFIFESICDRIVILAFPCIKAVFGSKSLKITVRFE